MLKPNELSATAASQAIARGELTSEALTTSCLERISERDNAVKAWIHLDPAHALAQARECDKQIVSAGGPSNPLHGIPIGVKDIIDTVDMPTTSNSPIHAGYRPSIDAECIRIARAAGAVILGKTDTVEFAAGGRMALTRHPRDPLRTPGGSSSGSGAAVGDYQVPIAFGTQTAGSLIRPASYNGIYAFKPTHGTVAWSGTRQYAPSLDTIGWYGRDVEDLALMARLYRLRGFGEATPPTPADVTVGLCSTPFIDACEPASVTALETAARRLEEAGVQVRWIDLPEDFYRLKKVHEIVMLGEGQPHFLGEYVEHGDKLHEDFRRRVDNETGISRADLLDAYDVSADARKRLDALFDSDLDVIIAPAATGEAPLGLHSTGDWTMNAFWTLLHAPLLAIPVTEGPFGMPVGVQMIGPRLSDPELLSIAGALAPIVALPSA